ncbi:hypothetical protein [Haladaptatus sp. ZSTT2]|uniref:hypothetical protein n=1 Tax=Haladaptatus sp. ZSTT2 TaxID=3120515 RepID=UPI00300E7059
MSILEFPDFVQLNHVVGSTRLSLESQPRFKNVSTSSIPAIGPAAESYDREYTYKLSDSLFAGKRTFSLSISKAAYEYCTNRPRIRGEYGFYGADPLNDALAKEIAVTLEKSHGRGSRDAVTAAIRFVQSMKYTSDSVTARMDEYQRYPIETLVEEGGDCEDSAILLGSILKQMGYGVKGLLLPGHMALGIKGSDDISGTYYNYNGDRYYYIETTGSGWGVGDMPDEYRSSKARLVDLYGYPVMNYSVSSMALSGSAPTYMYSIANNGDATARNVVVTTTYRDSSGQIINGERNTISTISLGGAKSLAVSMLSPPRSQAVSLHTEVTVAGKTQVSHGTRLLY